MTHLSAVSMNALGGERNVRLGDPRLVQLLGSICESADMPGADLLGYQTIKRDLESPWFSSSRGGVNSALMVSFVNWCADRLPATASMTYSLFNSAFLPDYREQSWDKKLSYAFASKNESLQEFELVALASTLSVSFRHYTEKTPYEREEFHTSMAILYGVMLSGMERLELDERTEENLRHLKKRGQVLFLKEMFLGRDLMAVKKRLTDGLSDQLKNDPQSPGSFSQFQAPLNALFGLASACASQRLLWSPSASSSFIVMADYLDLANRARSSEIDMLNPEKLSSLVLESLSLKADIWRKTLASWDEGANGYHTWPDRVSRVYAGLEAAGVSRSQIEQAATHFLPIFAAFCVRRKAGDKLPQKMLNVLFEYGDFAKARAKCSPSARKVLGNYAIANRPEWVSDLNLEEKGRTLENVLGL